MPSILNLVTRSDMPADSDGSNDNMINLMLGLLGLVFLGLILVAILFLFRRARRQKQQTIQSEEDGLPSYYDSNSKRFTNHRGLTIETTHNGRFFFQSNPGAEEAFGSLLLFIDKVTRQSQFFVVVCPSLRKRTSRPGLAGGGQRPRPMNRAATGNMWVPSTANPSEYPVTRRAKLKNFKGPLVMVSITEEQEDEPGANRSHLLLKKPN
ncbi:hypothetical protein FOC4_g10010579 [Fusarium odoratissimum]|uniref:Uncharacterized protein n=2 Tax=Fusarium oxysporum species complex TaxID=171631 RepID=N1RC72_FUSC4|nr:hypothetical protein FOC4_g10010579 [Fusarium odoratissimum]